MSLKFMKYINIVDILYMLMITGSSHDIVYVLINQKDK